MSAPRPKTLQELLSELDRATQQAHELAAQTQAPLEEELLHQLKQHGRPPSSPDGGTNEA